MIKIVILLILFVVSGCSEIIPPVQFEGSWYSCFQTDYTKSQKVLISIQGTTYHESVSNYENNVGCAGTPVSEDSFIAQITFGELGKSEFDPGGTNVTLDLDAADPYGCGPANPVYTYWRIQDNKGFFAAKSPPSCDPSNRGSNLGNYFTRYQ